MRVATGRFISYVKIQEKKRERYRLEISNMVA
jgi:hypothetical protein